MSVQKKRKLIIFCKAPILGEVKTRLIPDLGETRATALHRQLATNTINTCIAAARIIPNLECQLWCSPLIDHPFYHQFDMAKKLQLGDDLGERMHLALAHSLGEKMIPTVLVGTDCPNLTSDYLSQAFRKLETHEVVLGPAEDGGYGLVGLSRPNIEMFANITWGTNAVCVETCRVLNQQKINYGLLPLLWDVDRIEDVHRYEATYSGLSDK